MNAPPRVLDIAAVASLAGVTAGTIRAYRSRGYLPPPDLRLGGSPCWHEETIREWLATRPGKGAGAGRPRRSA